MEKIIKYDNIKEIYSIDLNGNIKNINSGKYLKPAITGAGYYTIGLQQNDNSRKIYYVHRLVAETFLVKNNNLDQVNHLDKNRRNNNIFNLEWCSQLDNIIHQNTNLNIPIIENYQKSWSKVSKGSENGMAKINEEQCHYICSLLEQGYTRTEVLDFCNLYVTYDIIRFIHTRKRWTHISKYYKW